MSRLARARMADERQLLVLARQVRRVREFIEHDGVDSAQEDRIRQFRTLTEDQRRVAFAESKYVYVLPR